MSKPASYKPSNYVLGLMFVVNMKFSSGNLSHDSNFDRRTLLFNYTTLILSENCHKRALCADRRPLRRDTIALRDRFRPMRARQN